MSPPFASGAPGFGSTVTPVRVLHCKGAGGYRTKERKLTERRDDRDTHGDDALESDRSGGWAGVPEALTEPIEGAEGTDPEDSSLVDDTPGSQGEIEAGSEGDFGKRGN